MHLYILKEYSRQLLIVLGAYFLLLVLIPNDVEIIWLCCAFFKICNLFFFLLPYDPVSVSISNLYPGCENVSVRSRSMMFEPGLTKGMLEVFVSPAHHSHCSADDQSTKAIDVQNAYLNGNIWINHIMIYF